MNDRLEIADVKRLGQIAVKTDLQIVLAVSRHRVRGQRNNGGGRPVFLTLAKSLERFWSIQNGHMDIEQDDIEARLTERLESLFTILRFGNDGPAGLNDAASDHPVDRVVVDHKDAAA